MSTQHPRWSNWRTSVDGVAPLSPASASDIFQAWQGGFELVGFVSALPDDIRLVELGPEIEAFLNAYLGKSDPPSNPSAYYEQNLRQVRATAASQIVQEIGALVGEAAVEAGWAWGQSPEFGVVVHRASTAFRVYDLVGDVLEQLEPTSVVTAALQALQER